MATKTALPASIWQRPDVFVPGATGPVGATGPQGSRGEIAVPGPAGMTGPTGPTAALGPTGPDQPLGPTGPRGATGPIDNAGGTGYQGYWGEGGPDGPQGPTGATGRIGVVGSSLAPQGETGPTGSIGVGNIGGLQVPFFSHPETYLTTPTLPVGQGDQVSWSYRDFNASTIYLVPIFVPYARTFTEMVIDSYQARYETVGFRLGIYECTQLMQPTTVIYDSGLIRPVGKGRMAVQFSRALQAKPYYLGLMTTDTTAYRCFATDEIAMSLGWRKGTDSLGWAFEIVALRTSLFNYSYNVGFVDLTNKTDVAANNTIAMIGIR